MYRVFPKKYCRYTTCDIAFIEVCICACLENRDLDPLQDEERYQELLLLAQRNTGAQEAISDEHGSTHLKLARMVIVDPDAPMEVDEDEDDEEDDKEDDDMDDAQEDDDDDQEGATASHGMTPLPLLKTFEFALVVDSHTPPPRTHAHSFPFTDGHRPLR